MQLLESLIAQSERCDALKHDHTAAPGGLWFDENARLNFVSLTEQAPPLKPTDWAFRQTCAKLGPYVFGRGSAKALPADYLQALPDYLRATVLNDHLRVAADSNRPWLVRGYGTDMRALLDANYPTVSNTELLKALDTLISAEASQFPDLQLVRPSVTADSLNLKVVWRNVGGYPTAAGEPRGPYGIGCYLGNGEIGNRKIRLLPQVQVHSCTNSVMLDTASESLVLAHRGSLASIIVLLKAALGRVLRSSAELLDRLILAESEKIENISDVLTGLAVQYGWQDKVTHAVWDGLRGRHTRAGLVGGVTYAAHTALADPDEQADMEILGGRILVADWSLFGQAAHAARSLRQPETVPAVWR